MGTFLSVSCRNNFNRRKNMGFSLVCVEKKVHLKNMFNVSKQLCFFFYRRVNIYYHFQREGAHRVTVQRCLNAVGQHGSQ